MSAEPIKVLIAGADASVRHDLRMSLTAHGYAVYEARTGEEAVLYAGRQKPGLVLLDVDLPLKGGLTACQRLRAILPQAGLVTISGSDREDDTIRALDAGADDCVVKPFGSRELVARLRAIARRSLGDGAEQPVLRAGEIELNADRRTVLKGGVPVRLSRIEFDLLRYLMGRAGKPVVHSCLLRAVCGPEYGSELEYLRTYMKRLRRKIERDPGRPEYLITVPWFGYSFSTPAATRQAAAAAHAAG